MTAASLTACKLRIARPTNDIAALLPFYRDGLGFTELTSFHDQDYDGIMLGQAGSPWHLEFTSQTGHVVPNAPTEDNLLVFYLPDKATWDAAVEKMRNAGHTPVKAANPYWESNGLTFEDADGYRVVLQNAAWTL